MPIYGMGLVPLPLPSCPSHQSPSGEIRENKQLLPHLLRQWFRAALLKAGTSVLVHLNHQERQAEANSKLARALMALPGQPATGALNLLLVQSKASSGVAASRWLTHRLSSCLPVVCWRITYQFPMEWESLERSFPNLVWKYSLEPCNWSLVWA